MRMQTVLTPTAAICAHVLLATLEMVTIAQVKAIHLEVVRSTLFNSQYVHVYIRIWYVQVIHCCV